MPLGRRTSFQGKRSRLGVSFLTKTFTKLIYSVVLDCDGRTEASSDSASRRNGFCDAGKQVGGCDRAGYARVTCREKFHLIVAVALNNNGDSLLDDDRMRDRDWYVMRDRNWNRMGHLKNKKYRVRLTTIRKEKVKVNFRRSFRNFVLRGEAREATTFYHRQLPVGNFIFSPLLTFHNIIFSVVNYYAECPTCTTLFFNDGLLGQFELSLRKYRANWLDYE